MSEPSPTPAGSPALNPNDPTRKIYRAGEHVYSIFELLASAVSPEYLSNQLPRVSDFTSQSRRAGALPPRQ